MSDTWWMSRSGAARAAVVYTGMRQAAVVATKSGAMYVCRQCGKKFRIGNCKRKFCSKECSAQARRERKYHSAYLAASEARKCEKCGEEESIALLMNPVKMGRTVLLCEDCECEVRGVESLSEAAKERRAARRAAKKPRTRRAQPDEADALESNYRAHWGGKKRKAGKSAKKGAKKSARKRGAKKR